jgi:soluble cytochrome b562
MLIPARAALAAVAGLVLLAGCSGSSTAPTSAPAASTASCTALATTMNESATTMQKAMSDIGTDPQKAVKALQGFKDTFEQAVAKVDNAEVRAQADKALAATKEMVSAIEAVTKDPTKVAGVSDALTAFQEEMTKIGTVCGG